MSRGFGGIPGQPLPYGRGSVRFFQYFLVAFFALPPAQSQDARQIVAESQKRSQSKSLQYEGTLEVSGSGNKVSVKHWELARTGAFGASKSILRFTAPPEVKGVALLIVNHPDRESDQWMWTPG